MASTNPHHAMNPHEKGYWTTGELAKAIGRTRQIVRRWILDGKIEPTETTDGGHHRFSEAKATQIIERFHKKAKAKAEARTKAKKAAAKVAAAKVEKATAAKKAA